MKSIIKYLPVAMLMIAAGCKSNAPGEIVGPPMQLGTGVSAAVPDAIVYQMNGDYARYVPVTLNESRTEIVSWPAPSDITTVSTPIKLAGGWYLDRRGITPTSGFLSYTYKEYAKLPQSITPKQLMEQLIPDARVTEIRRLPIKLWQAAEDPVEASRLVENSPTIFQATD